MYRDKGFSYRSNTNLHLFDKEEAKEKDLKTIASNILDNRIKSYNQLERFYMPVMKKVFEDTRSTNPSLKSPEELIFSSKLLSMKQSEDRLHTEILKKDNEAKNNKIFKLQNKVKMLENKLITYQPGSHLESRYEQPYSGLKRVETYLQIKNDQSLFRAKMRACSLLEQFNVQTSDIEIINMKTSQSQVLDHLLSKLKPMGSQYRNLLNGNFQKTSMLQSKQTFLEYQNKELRQSIDLMKNAEENSRKQLINSQNNLNNANNKIISLEKQSEQKDTQIFRLKKLLEEKNESIKFINKQTSNKLEIQNSLRRDNQQQAIDLAVIAQSSSIQNLELRKKLEETEEELQSLKYAYQFKSQELQKAHRLYVTLKSRYEPQESHLTFSYSPKALHELQKAKLRQNMVLSSLDDKNRDEYPTTHKQRIVTSEFAPRIYNSSKIEEAVNLRKKMQEMQLKILREQAKTRAYLGANFQVPASAQKYAQEYEYLKERLFKIQNDLQDLHDMPTTKGRNS